MGITGSVGKTSTKDILAALVRPHRRTVAAEDGFNNEIGLPLTVCRIEPDTEVVVAELSMRGPGQIRDLARIARPHIGVITSIAPVHLELLGSLENIARAKAELLEELEPGSVAVLPEHAPELEPFVPDGLDVRRFGAPESTVKDGRTRVRWRGRDVVFGFTARHQVANAAAALTAAEALGLEPPREPVDVEFSRWRSQEVALPGGGLLINDAWNANPVAMRAALAHLLERADGRRTVAVLGDMAELGPEAPRYHGEIGEAALEVDVVVGVGELARGYSAGRVGRDGGRRGRARRTRLVRPGDAILVKGSRSVGLEVVADALLEPAVVIRVLIAAGVALVVSIAIGPRFIEFLRRNEFGQHIREEGPKHHIAKQGTPTMGGLLILFAATIAFLPVSHYSAAGADRAVHGARVRGDRLPRRLHQAHAQAVARSLGPVEARPARGRDGRRRRRRAPPSPEHERLHPRRRRLGAALVRVVPVPLPRDRRARRTGRTSPTAPTGSSRGRRSSRCSRSRR